MHHNHSHSHGHGHDHHEGCDHDHNNHGHALSLEMSHGHFDHGETTTESDPNTPGKVSLISSYSISRYLDPCTLYRPIPQKTS